MNKFIYFIILILVNIKKLFVISFKILLINTKINFYKLLIKKIIFVN